MTVLVITYLLIINKTLFYGYNRLRESENIVICISSIATQSDQIQFQCIIKEVFTAINKRTWSDRTILSSKYSGSVNIITVDWIELIFTFRCPSKRFIFFFYRIWYRFIFIMSAFLKCNINLMTTKHWAIWF